MKYISKPLLTVLIVVTSTYALQSAGFKDEKSAIGTINTVFNDLFFNIREKQTYSRVNFFDKKFDLAYWNDFVSRLDAFVYDKATTLGSKDHDIIDTYNDIQGVAFRLVKYTNDIRMILQNAKQKYLSSNQLKYGVTQEEFDEVRSSLLRFTKELQTFLKNPTINKMAKNRLTLPHKKVALKIIDHLSQELYNTIDRLIIEFKEANDAIKTYQRSNPLHSLPPSDRR